MARRGRKSKKGEVEENGVEEKASENGQSSSQDAEQEQEKRKTLKRKSSSKKKDYDDRDDEGDSEEEYQEKKKKKSGSKKKSHREDTPDEDNSWNDSSSEKKSPSKRKSTTKSKGKENDAGGDEDESDDEGETSKDYEVEKVLDEKTMKGVKHYLIRWKGYESESDTWEPASTLNCPELIAEYKAKAAKKNKDKKKEKKKETDPLVTWDENADFEVDRILEVHFRRDGKREFLVSWKGYPASENSWEPEENMDCKELINKFMDKVERAKHVDTRELRTFRPATERLTLMMHQGSGRRVSKRGLGKQRVHYHDAE